MSVSVVVLNYNRPGYLWSTIIPTMMTYKDVDQVVISNGKEETDLSLEKITSKGDVKHLQHWDKMNKEYGLTLRFLSALEADNEYVLIMDDDILPTEETVATLLQKIKEEPDIIHGLYGRKFEKGKYTVENFFGEVPIVLTRCLITTKEKCRYFIDNFRMYENDLIKNSKPYWNGEDVLFSLMSLQKEKKMNRAYNLSHTNRILNYLTPSEMTKSISFTSTHLDHRSEICKKWLEMMNIEKLEEGKDEWRSQILYFIENTQVARYMLFGLSSCLFWG